MVRLKSRLTPLSSSGLLSPDEQSRVRARGITTVEELVGAIQGGPRSMQSVLGLSQTALDELLGRGISLLSPEMQAAIERQRGRTYPLGARLGRRDDRSVGE